MAKPGPAQKLDLNEKSRHIFEEMIATEITYAKSLSVLLAQDRCKLILAAFKKVPKKYRKDFSDASLAKMLSKIEKFHVISTALVRELNEPDLDAVAALMSGAEIHYQEYLMVYKSLPKQLNIAEIMATFAKDSPAKFVSVQSISDVLITPVQRLPRYVLLFDQILKELPKEHHQYQSFSNLHQQVKKITQKINQNTTPVMVQDKLLAHKTAKTSKAPPTSTPDKSVTPAYNAAKKSPTREVKKKLETFFDIENSAFLHQLYEDLPDKEGRKERQYVMLEKMMACVFNPELEMADILKALHDSYAPLFGNHNPGWVQDSQERTIWLEKLISLINEGREIKKLKKITSGLNPPNTSLSLEEHKRKKVSNAIY